MKQEQAAGGSGSFLIAARNLFHFQRSEESDPLFAHFFFFFSVDS